MQDYKILGAGGAASDSEEEQKQMSQKRAVKAAKKGAQDFSSSVPKTTSKISKLVSVKSDQSYVFSNWEKGVLHYSLSLNSIKALMLFSTTLEMLKPTYHSKPIRI